MDNATQDILSTLSKDEQIVYLLSLNEPLIRENDALSKDNQGLVEDLIKTKEESDHWHTEWAKLVEQIKIMNARYFGAKSEKIAPYQISLFNDVEAATDETVKEPDLKEVLPKKRKKKTSVDYTKFETVVIEHEIAPEKRFCPSCETKMEEMGTEIKRIIKVIPARLVVEEHRRHVYVCRPCSKANAENGSTPTQIVKAPLLHFPLEKSCASPELLAHIIHNKYSLAQPLYRIREDLKLSTGLTLSRQTLANWVIAVHERWFSRIYALMKKSLLKRSFIHADETGIQVLKEPNRTASKKSYMWLFAGDATMPPLYIFRYDETRARHVVTDFLGSWQGIIMADGYSVYDDLGEGITRVSCLVHIRRKFSDIAKGIGKDKLENLPETITLQALEYINKMFAIDNEFANMDVDIRKARRLASLKPKMETFYTWCLQKRDEALPSMALHEALTYAINQWPKLMNVFIDGRIPLDNNLAERSIRPFCVGRKNWLFSDTPNGAHASAAIYSITTTAKGNGLKPREYLTWLLQEMPNTENLEDERVLARFLPWSNEIPDSCRIEPVESITDPLDEPIVDIDPATLDED